MAPKGDEPCQRVSTSLLPTRPDTHPPTKAEGAWAGGLGRVLTSLRRGPAPGAASSAE